MRGARHHPRMECRFHPWRVRMLQRRQDPLHHRDAFVQRAAREPETRERHGKMRRVEQALARSSERTLQSHAKVRVFTLEPVQPHDLRRPAQLLGRALRERNAVRAMHAASRNVVAAVRETIKPVLAHGLEHHEPRLAIGLFLSLHEALARERRYQLERGHRHVAVAHQVTRHGFHRVERRTAGEHSKPAEQHPFRLREQVVAPVDHGAHGAVPRRPVGHVRAQQVDTLLEPRQDCAWRKERRARSRELQCERQSIEPAADLAHRGKRFIVEHERWLHGARAAHEQLHRLGVGNVQCALHRRRERRNRKGLFPLNRKRCAARGQHRNRGALGEQPGNERRRRQHMLHVVEHQQGASSGEGGNRAVSGRYAPAVAHTKHLGHGPGHQRRLGDFPERDEPHTVGIGVADT